MLCYRICRVRPFAAGVSQGERFQRRGQLIDWMVVTALRIIAVELVGGRDSIIVGHPSTPFANTRGSSRFHVFLREIAIKSTGKQRVRPPEPSQISRVIGPFCVKTVAGHKSSRGRLKHRIIVFRMSRPSTDAGSGAGAVRPPAFAGLFYPDDA